MLNYGLNCVQYVTGPKFHFCWIVKTKYFAVNPIKSITIYYHISKLSQGGSLNLDNGFKIPT
jgi:hypothetical protein